LIDGKPHELLELVDFGLRANPTTQNAWHQARSAAASLGMAESAWLPVLTAQFTAGYWRYPFPVPATAVSLAGGTTFPTAHLSWALFDRTRPAEIERATQQLVSLNLALNRNHQEVTYHIQQAFYGLVAGRARVAAAEMTLKQSTRNADSIRAQLARGLSTQPEYLMAVQDQARAAYDLQSAHGAVMEKAAELAEQLGMRPDQELLTPPLESQELPTASETSADEIIDAALASRPDLGAKLASLRAKEAEIRKAEANYWPQLILAGDGGWKLWNYHNAEQNPAQIGIEPVRTSQPVYDGYLQMNWNLFEGFSGVNSVKSAEAQRNAAQAEFETLQLKIMKEIWRAYAEFKTSVRRREFALAMLKASEKSYEGALMSYEQGVSTVIELITAERNLAQARYTDIDSRAGLLLAAASLVYAAGAGTGTEDFTGAGFIRP
jgi:outer membrane protein TolC